MRRAPCLVPLACLALGVTLQAKAAGLLAPDPIHLHQQVQLPQGVAVPRLGARLIADADDGFNLHLAVQEFALEPPELAGHAPGVLDGHAHLFINGEKIGRVYGRYVHVPAARLRQGVNQITVTLNSHRHETWVVDGKPFLVTLFIDPTRTEPVLHVFSSSAPREMSKR